MKRYRQFILALCFCMFLSACGGTEGREPFDEPQQSAMESASEIEEAIMSVEEELTRQLQGVLDAIDEIAAGEIRTEKDRMTVTAQVEDTIAAVGYPVRRFRTAMPNYEMLTAFMRDDEAEHITVYQVRGWDSISVSANTYIRKQDGFAWIYSSIQHDETGWTLSVGDEEPLSSLVLTEKGNLLAYSRADLEPYGYRVVPLSDEQYQMYADYAALVDSQSVGVLIQNWSADADFRYLPWDNVFETIWESENQTVLVDEESPYYHTLDTGEYEHYVTVPAEIVEGTLQKYFDVSAETLRDTTSDFYDETPLYNPEDETYTMYGFRGGGYKPSVEVWEIHDNEDGSISLDLAWVSLDFADEGFVYSTLTVMPLEGGGYHYLSNRFSEETAANIVRSSLHLAQSLEYLQQGEFKTTGDAVEIGGQRFTPVDTDDFYGKISLGGLASTKSIRNWYATIFTEDAAAKYLDRIFEIPLYADRESDADGNETLLVNPDRKGEPIARGRWDTDSLTVQTITVDEITVQMRFETDQGAELRSLSIVPGTRAEWLLTGSYEGNNQ